MWGHGIPFRMARLQPSPCTCEQPHPFTTRVTASGRFSSAGTTRGIWTELLPRIRTKGSTPLAPQGLPRMWIQRKIHRYGKNKEYHPPWTCTEGRHISDPGSKDYKQTSRTPRMGDAKKTKKSRRLPRAVYLGCFSSKNIENIVISIKNNGF